MFVWVIVAGGNRNSHDNRLSWIMKRDVGVCLKVPFKISTRESEITVGQPARKLLQTPYLQGSRK
jgi:hypothetical protein